MGYSPPLQFNLVGIIETLKVRSLQGDKKSPGGFTLDLSGHTIS